MCLQFTLLDDDDWQGSVSLKTVILGGMHKAMESGCMDGTKISPSPFKELVHFLLLSTFYAHGK